MRYRPEHKAKVRQRILRAAGRLFRRRGYHGVGIDRIMAAARLTRGGFYGYFRSKSALFAAVLAEEHDFNRRLRGRPGETPAELAASAVTVADGYLDPANRERVGPNCALASLSIEVSRSDAAARQAYTEKVRRLVAEFARGLPGAAADDGRALRSLALCAGGLIIARALADDRFAGRLLAACRAGVHDELL